MLFRSVANRHVLKDLTTGDLLNVRVVAVNAGGRSEPAALVEPVPIREVVGEYWEGPGVGAGVWESLMVGRLKCICLLFVQFLYHKGAQSLCSQGHLWPSEE